MLFVCLALIDDEQDKIKFTEFYNEYNDFGLNYAYSLLNDRSLAQDAVSEAFLRLAKCFQKINNSKLTKLPQFFVIIIRNICIDMIRKESEQMTLSFESVDLKAQVRYYDDSFKGYEDNMHLRECIKKLPQHQKDILYLRTVAGMEFIDIAKFFGINTSSARKRYITACKKLEKLFKKGDVSIEKPDSENT